MLSEHVGNYKLLKVKGKASLPTLKQECNLNIPQRFYLYGIENDNGLGKLVR